MNLPSLATDGFVDGAIPPLLQAAGLFNRFVAGEPFERPLPREMRPVGGGIWELRTDDLRFFGWFPRPKIFVITAAHPKKVCKDKHLYPALKAQAAHDRANIGLWNGNFMTGNIDDLI